MNIILLTPDDKGENLTQAEIDEFWDQGISMDDWDYMLLVPEEEVQEEEGEDEADGTPTKEWRPINYVLERMMTGCCKNVWKLATYRGKRYAVGVAYHA